MRILFITRGFPSESNPMDGNYEAVQAKAIAAKGHQVSVIAIKWKSFSHFFCDQSVRHRRVDGIDVYECIKTYPFNPLITMPKIELRWRQRLFRKVFRQYLCEQGMPDIVHAHIINIAAPAIILKNDYHLPFVITEHWTKMNVNAFSQRLQALTFVYHHADRVICVSQALAESLHRNFQVESVVINNMVSNLFFQDKKICRNDDLFHFIAVGALRKNKGFDILIEAFSKAHFPQNVRLDIIGGGEEYEHLKVMVTNYGLTEQVQLLGVLTPEEVSKRLCRSDCFVLSSRLETFAIVVIEAMAKGLPVIATACGGPETFVRPSEGMLISKENVTELSMAMQKMLTCYKDYDSERIRQYCYEHFSQDVIAEQIIDIYKQVLY